MARLNTDILHHIARSTAEDDDYATLHSCSLVSKPFNYAASKFLYQSVNLSLDTPRSSEQCQELPRIWSSAILPSNAAFVSNLEVTGFWVAGYAPENFSCLLRDSILTWGNLKSVTLAPIQYSRDTVADVVAALSQCQELRILTINYSCHDAKSSDALVKLTGLESLTIRQPTGFTVGVLPEWLARLRPTLRSLRFMDDCRFITPDIFRTLLPHIMNVRSFSLGWIDSASYAETLSSVIEQMERLSRLECWIWSPSSDITTGPRLRNLTSLTVNHRGIFTKIMGDYLTRWIRQLCSASPLEILEVQRELRYRSGVSPIGLDGLLRHVAAKHGQTLRELVLPELFVGMKALAETGIQLQCLERLEVTTSKAVVARLSEVFGSYKSLRTLVVSTPNKSPSKRPQCDASTVSAFMGATSCLRHFTLNESRWEGAWVSMADGAVVFDVKTAPVAAASRSR